MHRITQMHACTHACTRPCNRMPARGHTCRPMDMLVKVVAGDDDIRQVSMLLLLLLPPPAPSVAWGGEWLAQAAPLAWAHAWLAGLPLAGLPEGRPGVGGVIPCGTCCCCW